MFHSYVLSRCPRSSRDSLVFVRSLGHKLSATILMIQQIVTVLDGTWIPRQFNVEGTSFGNCTATSAFTCVLCVLFRRRTDPSTRVLAWEDLQAYVFHTLMPRSRRTLGPWMPKGIPSLDVRVPMTTHVHIVTHIILSLPLETRISSQDLRGRN